MILVSQALDVGGAGAGSAGGSGAAHSAAGRAGAVGSGGSAGVTGVAAVIVLGTQAATDGGGDEAEHEADEAPPRGLGALTRVGAIGRVAVGAVRIHVAAAGVDAR